MTLEGFGILCNNPDSAPQSSPLPGRPPGAFRGPRDVSLSHTCAGGASPEQKSCTTTSRTGGLQDSPPGGVWGPQCNTHPAGQA